MTGIYRFDITVHLLIVGPVDICYLFKDVLNTAAGRLELESWNNPCFPTIVSKKKPLIPKLLSEYA